MTVAYDSGFLRIDIEDASGNRQGYGPLVTMLSLTRTRELDRIGGISFPVPATDPRTQHLQVGYHYKAYHKVLGYLGEFVHQKATVQPGEHPTMVVQADDLLRELTAANCLFNREYSNNYLGTIVSDLLTLASGWGDGDIDNVGYTSLDFQGESVLNAIVLLAQAGGAHFRMGDSDRTLDFGTFGEDSGLRCMSVSVLGPELEDNDDLAIISSIEIAEEGGGIVNRLIPLGAGNGKSQLTLEHATVTDPSYPVQTGTNPDGSSYYYIEDTDSQTTYGLVVAPWARSDIRPLTNSDVDLANAANALYQVSLAALLRMKQPVTVYRLEIQKLRVDLRPGQTVQAIHQGTVMYDGTPYKWVDLDADMIVLAIRDQFSADGKISHSLDVSESGYRPVSDLGVVTDMHRDLQVIKAHLQPSISYNKFGPYVRDIDPDNDVDVDIRIGSEVLLLNHALLRFSTKPLRVRSATLAAAGATVGSTAAGGGGTSGSSGNHSHVMFSYMDDSPPGSPEREFQCTDGGGHYVYVGIKSDKAKSLHTSGMSADHSHSLPDHQHNITIPAHTHDVEYGLFTDTHYPQNIYLAINGIDRTSELGGPWAPTDAAVEVEVEMSEYLRDAAGGLRQTHTLTFTVLGGSDNQGTMEVQVDMLCTIQAIAVS